MIDTALDSFNFYFLFAVFQGLVLAGLILWTKPWRKPHLYFGLLILVFSISLLHLVLTQSIHAFNARFPVPMDFSLAYGPLAYLHVASIKNPKHRLHLPDILHFLPTLLIDGILFSLFFAYAGANMPWAYSNLEAIQTTALIITLLSLIQLCVYAVAIYRLIRNAQTSIREFDKIRAWLSYLLFSSVAIAVFLLIAIPALLLNVKWTDENSLLYNPFGMIIGLCIYGLGYLYLLRYRKAVDIYAERTERFKFTEEALQHKKQLLLQALEDLKFYKDQSISLGKVAQLMGYPVNDLSFLINEGFHTNFNDWINHHRIQAFKDLLRNPENKKYSLTGLSQEVGFSSKASFYRAFKKATGITPSDYMTSEGLK